MQGEYRGDFTRDTFDPAKRFLRVLYQQGRVQLDADHNEQVSILLHYLQSLVKDLYGRHGGPCNSGFLITPTQPPSTDFNIGHGHYYVDGILCEAADTTYRGQPDPPVAKDEQLTNGYNLVYLDVWEQHITHIEDDSIREVALGRPDTATRAKVVWQVKVENEYVRDSASPHEISELIRAIKDGSFFERFIFNLWQPNLWQPNGRLKLKAKAKEDLSKDTDPCITPPESRYRGVENQLYRVEVHRKGEAWNGKKKQEGGNQDSAATFKWSRDNGSVVFPIHKLAGTEVVLEHLGRDEHLSLSEQDWVEVIDDDLVLRGQAGPLVQVISVDRMDMKVTLRPSPDRTYDETTSSDHPLLRRWDQREGDPKQGRLTLVDGAVLISESDGAEAGWLALEDGVQIQFQPYGEAYRTGDYWLIPARTASGDVEGDVEWPGPVGQPEAVPPHGVEHHYAPLAIISVAPNGEVTLAVDGADLRSMKQLSDCGETPPSDRRP